jgi:hypothetical protein
MNGFSQRFSPFGTLATVSNKVKLMLAELMLAHEVPLPAEHTWAYWKNS